MVVARVRLSCAFHHPGTLMPRHCLSLSTLLTLLLAAVPAYSASPQTTGPVAEVPTRQR